jgi:RimJ/RimL family protein N-acetyltransferase
MVRDATATDVPRIVAMGQRFAATSEYATKLPVTPTHLEALAHHLLTSADGALFVAEQGDTVIGMLAMTVYTHPMTGARVASELAWWMEPEYRGRDGVRLLRRAEQWAKGQQADHVVMIAPNDRVSALYATVGYTKAETVFEKRV